MTDDPRRNDTDALQYAQKAMTWRGRGCSPGLGLVILAIGGLVALPHLAAVIA
jgi:hypothetical protein